MRIAAIAFGVVVAMVALLLYVGTRHSLKIPTGAQYRPDDYVVVSLNRPVSCSVSSALKVGSHIPGRFAVHTGKNGRIGLVTRRGTYIYLGPDTDFAVVSRNGSRLNYGRVYCNNRSDIKLIATPSGEIHLLGTVLDANVLKKGPAIVTVVKGKVKLVNSHGAALVTEGKQAVLTAKSAPAEGIPVNTLAETSWHDGRGQVISDCGEFAYTVLRKISSSAGAFEIWTMRADGTDKHRIRTSLGPAMPTFWIPGRELILVGNFTRPVLLNLVTGQDTRLNLPENLQVMSEISISPNGRLLAFSATIRHGRSFDEDEDGVFIYDIVTGELRKIVDDWRGCCPPSPNWSRDGRYLIAAFQFGEIVPGRFYGEDRELYVVDIATGKCIPTGIKGNSPVFSPDGGRVAYIARTVDSNFRDGSPNQSAIFVADLRHGEKRWPVTALESGAWYPRWSPDGTRILFYRQHENPEKDFTKPHTHGISLHVAAADGSGEKEIFRSRQVRMRWCSWTSGGNAVYLQTWTSGNIWTMGFLGSVLKIAADGSGVIADLGGNEKDSHLSVEEARQTSAAVMQMEAATGLGNKATELMQKGDFARFRAICKQRANILASIAWKYPLAALSVDNLLRWADALDTEAARSDAQILDEECQEHMERARRYIGAYVETYGKLPDNLEAARDAIVELMKRSGDYDEPRTAETDAFFTGAFYCPGKSHRDPVLYRFDAQGKMTLGANDILISCPNHPKNKLTSDRRLLRKLNGQ